MYYLLFITQISPEYQLMQNICWQPKYCIVSHFVNKYNLIKKHLKYLKLLFQEFVFLRNTQKNKNKVKH